MRKVATAAALAAICALLVTTSRPAAADVLVNVSKTSQRMSVLVDGTSRYNWKVSTGAKRYTTPSGVYQPQWLARKWRSKQYNNAPMPHSIFFHQGYAIHGTTEIARLGKIASHGCVRLHPENAAKLFELVEKQMKNTRIVVSDDVIDAPDETPKKKNNKYISEQPSPKKADTAAPKKKVELRGMDSLAMATDEALGKASKAEKADSSEPKSRPGRSERRASRSSAGFHW